MRPVDIARLRTLLPADWEERARAATEEVRAAAPGDRSAVIDRHAKLWRELKDDLASLLHRKCWYCESRQERSDNAVDHFRPKNRVAERPEHGGYWWLAFDWHNYRFSCTFCNSRRRNREGGTSGGKQDHFPLLDEAARVFDEGGNLNRENAELLDPTRPGDTAMLWLGDDDGHVRPRAPEDRQPQFRMADASIRLYHLDHPDMVEARVELYRQVKQQVELGNDQYDAAHVGNPEALRAYNSAATVLVEMKDVSRPYSAAVRDMIRGLRDDYHWWIDGV